MSIDKMKSVLREKVIPGYDKIVTRFFKPEDVRNVFIGIKIPDIRRVAKLFFKEISLAEIDLLFTHIHEERILALLILVEKFKKSNLPSQKEIVEYYLSRMKFLNSWDLVDLSAKIIGLLSIKTGNTDLIYFLSKSDSMWERRVAIVSTLEYVRLNKLDLPLNIVQPMLQQKEDLINKAMGWVLREVGKKDVEILKDFLSKNISNISTVSLRYSLEKFDLCDKIHYRALKKREN